MAQSRRVYFLISIYLLAIVAANLSTTIFGPGATIVNAFIFIGLDLTSRDKLHDLWNGKHLALKMFTLIVVGSAISYALNRSSGKIALASLVAFALAAIADTVAYAALRDRAHLVKINGSNIISAAVDSLLFPTLAFGGVMPLISLGQFVAKVAGGYIWSLIIRKR